MGSPSALGITCGNGCRGKVQMRRDTPSKINKKSSGQEEISTRLLNLWERRSNTPRDEQDSSSPIGFIVFTVSEVITHLLFTPLKPHSKLLLIRPSSTWRSTRKTPSQNLWTPVEPTMLCQSKAQMGSANSLKSNFLSLNQCSPITHDGAL